MEENSNSKVYINILMMDLSPKIMILELPYLYCCYPVSKKNWKILQCIQCYDYQYQQIVDESTYITVVLDAGIYCLGDYIFQVQNTNQFLEIMNDSLLNLITSNGYCEYITNNDS